MAKQCPVRAQWDLIRPCEPLPVSRVLERRFEAGRRFEAEVVAGLLPLHPGACVVAGEDRAEREAATAAAMTAGAPVIVGGRLPPDPAGRRVGEPDLLVPAEGPGYRPVDIKHHRCLDPGSGGMPAYCSPLDRLTWEAADLVADSSARKRRDDLLQLAHQRMLEACGMHRPTAGSAASSASTASSPGTTWTRPSGRPPRRPGGRNGGRPWRCTTSSSGSGWTSSPWPPHTRPTRGLTCWWCRYGSPNAGSARGGLGAARRWRPVPVM